MIAIDGTTKRYTDSNTNNINPNTHPEDLYYVHTVYLMPKSLNF